MCVGWGEGMGGGCLVVLEIKGVGSERPILLENARCLLLMGAQLPCRRGGERTQPDTLHVSATASSADTCWNLAESDGEAPAIDGVCSWLNYCYRFISAFLADLFEPSS